MKREIKVYKSGKIIKKEILYIPFRYILAMLITIFEIIAVIGIVFFMAKYLPYFYVLIYITVFAIVLSIVASHDNPDYKIPWLLFVICVPIVGFMTYFMFYERKLSKKFRKRFNRIKESLEFDDLQNKIEIANSDKLIASQALQLCEISGSHLYKNTNIEYFSIGEKMFLSILEELKKAEKFIFLEFFIIEEGLFWNKILEILKEKAKDGVEIKVIYDDIGCMMTLPGNYFKRLAKYNIECVPFSMLKGQANNEFNNRSHRKILVIDGKVAYTGGVNLADEYINHKEIYGHWKDTAIKLNGEAVNELTKLFLMDYFVNIKEENLDFNKYYINYKSNNNSFVIPFGDGPRPIYDKNVGKTVIMNMLNQAKEYVYITTPYLIIDNEMMKAIENTSLRGIDVRIIVPHIPDKKIVFQMTISNYQALINSGVKIYEYEPGFIHSKLYISDDNVAMIGTINLDYRSLVHHFENGVWIYKDSSILKMKDDFIETMNKSIYMNGIKKKDKLFNRFIRAIVRIFSPLL